jgi:hypothetical protein
MCQHVLGMPDLINYRKYLLSKVFSGTECYKAITNRCYSEIPSHDQFLRFLKAIPTADDITQYEKLGLWINSNSCFVSTFYKNVCFRNIPQGSSINIDEKKQQIVLSRDSPVNKKIQAIVETGLQHMTAQDFVEPSGDTIKYEDPIGNCWAYYVRRFLPSLYIAGQVQVNVPYRDLSKSRQAKRKTESDTTARLDFLFNGETDVAIELVRNGEQNDENEKHWERFSEDYKEWKDRCAVLNFQMSGKKVTPIKGANLYTFLYESNELYHGNALIRTSVASIPSINLKPGKPFSTLRRCAPLGIRLLKYI